VTGVVSSAGGPDNQPLGKAVGQIAADGLREPPIDVADRNS
jgi:hypothetical protein